MIQFVQFHHLSCLHQLSQHFQYPALNASSSVAFGCFFIHSAACLSILLSIIFIRRFAIFAVNIMAYSKLFLDKMVTTDSVTNAYNIVYNFCGAVYGSIHNVNSFSIGFFVIVWFIAQVTCFCQTHLKSSGIWYSETNIL